MSNVSCTIFTQLLHKSNNFFLIEYLWPTCKKTNPMVDKKKIELCKSCVKVVQKTLLFFHSRPPLPLGKRYLSQIFFFKSWFLNDMLQSHEMVTHFLKQ
jgi:hypothetical protein